jgi:hypothetical protein
MRCRPVLAEAIKYYQVSTGRHGAVLGMSVDVVPCPCLPNVVLTLPLNGDAVDVLALVITVFAALTVANILVGDPLSPF